MNRLGRTNTEFPSIWASLRVDASTPPSELVSAVRELGIPLDISSQPALWGGFLRGGSDTLAVKSTSQFERGTSQDHATDLMQAHLIEVLSSVGREMIDFYFLRVRRVVEEYQINGALAALEFARQEGHIRFVGLVPEGPALAVQALWQFHDAFEVLLASREEDQPLRNLAVERRVGIVELASGFDVKPDSAFTMIRVGSLEDVARLRELMQEKPCS